MKLIVGVSVVLVLFGLGCVSNAVQVRPHEGYQGTLYDAASVGPKLKSEILDFLVRDKTDQNEYIEDEYMCEEFAADLWWNAYNEGIEGCIVWVYVSPSFHTLVKFDTTDGELWVEPSLDITGSDCWYEVWRTFCGESAFNKCVNVKYKSIYRQ